VVDLALPLLLTTSEFLLFGLLAYNVTGLAPSVAVRLWWFALAAFGVATLGTLSRAYYLIKAGSSAGDSTIIARAYLRRQRGDIAVVSAILVWGVANGIFQLWLEGAMAHPFNGLTRNEVSFFLTLPATLALAVGLIVLGRTARELRANLSASIGSADVPNEGSEVR
jgi:hypothetical protein